MARKRWQSGSPDDRPGVGWPGFTEADNADNGDGSTAIGDDDYFNDVDGCGDYFDNVDGGGDDADDEDAVPGTTAHKSDGAAAGGDNLAGVGVHDGMDDIQTARCTRQRAHKEPFPEHVADGLARRDAAGVERVVTTPFGNARRFATSHLFLHAWNLHEQNTLTRYQSRNSQTVENANSKRVGAAQEPSDQEQEDGPYPDRLGHIRIVRRCRHGIFRQPRGTGQRTTKASDFIRCEARITLSAVYDTAERKWFLETRDEGNCHNHKCSQAVLDSHGKSVLLSKPAVVTEIHRTMQARALARNICDTIASNYGIVITPKQLANLKRDRLGGLSASANLKLLLERFASFQGSSCLIVDDQHGQVCGVVLQSAAQKAMFDRFGDNLILDWTHNTNNMGFYLGSFMVTSATGRGVSVCDFLCLEQTEAMMTCVFRHFIKTNLGAVDKVKSFIIDKDYKEWRVLERLFKKSIVLLCQFHVVKWFVFVVTKKKYNLSLELRDAVLDIVYAMIYARTTERFDLLRENLRELLEETSPNFLSYMAERWYGCRRMWSDCERATVFTALNTTSNRIESSWNQVKTVLGKKLRIDLCVESVFSYETSVLRREYKMINKYASKMIQRSECDSFIRSAMAEVCEYASGAVVKQWVALQHQARSASPYVASHHPDRADVHSITRPGPESPTYFVDARVWRCSCHFSVTSHLPCRHIIHVAKDVLKLDELPVSTVPRRWNLLEAASLLPVLTRSTPEIQSLRTGLLLSDAAFSELVEPDFFELNERCESVPRRVAYFRLNRKEVSDVVVLNNLEKRGIIEAEFSVITRFLMAQSTPQFMKMAADLRDVLGQKKTEWLSKEWLSSVSSKSACVPEVHDPDRDVAPQHDTVSEMNDMDEVIASAMAEEEKAYNDTGEKLRLAQIKRRAAETHARTETYVPSTQPSTQVQMPVCDVPPPQDPAPDPTPRRTHLIDDLLQDVCDESHPFDDYAYGGSSPVDLDAFIPFPYAKMPPTEVNDGTHSHTVTQDDLRRIGAREQDEHAHHWPTTHSVSSSSASAIMNQVAEHQLRSSLSPSSDASIAASSLSSIMLNVAAHQLHVVNSDAPPRKRPATGKADSINVVLSLVTNDAHHGMYHSTLPAAAKKQKTTTFPKPHAAGTTKKQKSSGPPTGDRLGYVDLQSRCSVQVRACTAAFTTKCDISSVLPLWSKVPLRLTETLLDKMAPSADYKIIPAETNTLNFRIPRRLTQSLIQSIKEARLFGGKRRSHLGITVDTTASNLYGYVASLHKTLRGFSEQNLQDLHEFNCVFDKCESYNLDLFWLRTDGDAALPRIPYALGPMDRESRWASDDASHGSSDDISCGDRDAIRSVLETCSLQTTFATRIDRADLHMKISVSEFIGYLPRSSRLNDAVMMFVLRQLATEYEDIHVFECLAKVKIKLPTKPMRSYRWVIFPRHVDGCHWCIIFCQPNGGGAAKISIYDPMQGPFVAPVSRQWKKWCRPVLQQWLSRDEPAGDVTEDYDLVELATQHDSTSCGVYCLAVALDRITGDYFFQERGEVGASASCQLRIRFLRQILFGSTRQDAPAQHGDEGKTLQALSAYEDDKPKRKKLK